MEQNHPDSQAKLQILLASAEERYKSIHIIRERIWNTCTWAIGIGLLVAGWIVQSDIYLNLLQRIIFSLFILISFVAIRFFYLKDIEKGFKTQLRIVARMEKALNLYEAGAFDYTDSGIYPMKWSNAGEKDGEGRYFTYSYLLLYISVAFLMLAIWAKFLFDKHNNIL